MEISVLIPFAAGLFSIVIAIVIALQERQGPARWFFLAGMSLLAIESACVGLAIDSILPGEAFRWQTWRLFAMSATPGIWLLFSLTYARGNYAEFLLRWRWSLIVAFVAPPLLAVVFRNQLLASLTRAGLGAPWTAGLGLPALALYVAELLAAVLILMNLERTYRAAVGTMRWRIKFIVIGLGVLFIVRAYTSSQALLFRSLTATLQAFDSAALLLACGLMTRSLFRSGHFNVQVYPSHSLLHNSLTVMLAGVYLVIVGVLAKVVTLLGGDTSFTLKAFVVLISLVLLTMLLLSDRVRLHTRRFVSRHFQRPLYDYRTVWRTFSENTARCVEQKDLCAVVAKLLSDIFQALSVSVWLVEDQKLVFAASTSVSAVKADHVNLEAADASMVIKALVAHPQPVDIDSSKETWASALRRLHPDEFQKGGNRVVVPLVASGELVGLMIIGDRVGGLAFSVQDFDLLKSAGDQAAASLLNIRLAQQLSQAKQLEAFQAMSAFFVHDLKNTASSLSLMLQNLPIHFNDPKFREDALRGVAKTVTHINDLISRLSLLRKELAVQPIEADLNALVNTALKCLDGASGVELVKELRPLPKVPLDPGQIENVITNLILNARDALRNAGQIRVETAQSNGSVMLSVTDNGCGMSPEFLQRSLFRPFQTTKKKGIGIGMFQCKTIVEAHRGRIEVESEPDKGTTFRVWLPVS